MPSLYSLFKRLDPGYDYEALKKEEAADNKDLIDFLKENNSGDTYYKQNNNTPMLYWNNYIGESLFKNSGKFIENTPYDPSSPYSATKASSDHLVRAWGRTFGLPATISNCSNNYGPYQFPEKLIPLMIINCLSYKSLPIYGKGENIRDWLYVEDHCKAIDLILQNGNIGETYNVGGSNEIRNIKIVESICNILDKLRPADSGGSYRELITYVKDRPGHDYRYSIDSTRIKNELNWEPKESFDTGLIKTIKWYLKNELWWKKIQNHVYKQERLGVAS